MLNITRPLKSSATVHKGIPVHRKRTVPGARDDGRRRPAQGSRKSLYIISSSSRRRGARRSSHLRDGGGRKTRLDASRLCSCRGRCRRNVTGRRSSGHGLGIRRRECIQVDQVRGLDSSRASKRLGDGGGSRGNLFLAGIEDQFASGKDAAELGVGVVARVALGRGIVELRSLASLTYRC
jgi:hypothetical protein